VRLADVCADVKLAYDIYIFLQQNSKFVRLVRQGTVLAPFLKQRLGDSGVRHLFLPKEQRHEFEEQYAVQHIVGRLQ
jgi:hypothetical protein